MVTDSVYIGDDEKTPSSVTYTSNVFGFTDEVKMPDVIMQTFYAL